MSKVIIKSKKKKPIELRTTHSLSVDIELYKKIDEISSKTNVPKTKIANQLLEFALENVEID